MDRPKIKIKLTFSDWLLEFIGAIAFLMLVILPILYYSKLPDSLPSHYNAFGQPDAYGSRSGIWILPIIGLVLYFGMSILNKYPYVFNYPVVITSTNAERVYKIGTRTIRILKVIFVVTFAYINFNTINTGLGNTIGLGNYFLIIYFGLVLLTIVFSIILTVKNK